MNPKPLTETYYAVQIGKEPNDAPYFMVRDDLVPELFTNKKAASEKRPSRRSCKVVKVAVTVIT